MICTVYNKKMWGWGCQRQYPLQRCVQMKTDQHELCAEPFQATEVSFPRHLACPVKCPKTIHFNLLAAGNMRTCTDIFLWHLALLCNFPLATASDELLQERQKSICPAWKRVEESRSKPAPAHPESHVVKQQHETVIFHIGAHTPITSTNELLTWLVFFSKAAVQQKNRQTWHAQPKKKARTCARGTRSPPPNPKLVERRAF